MGAEPLRWMCDTWLSSYSISKSSTLRWIIRAHHSPGVMGLSTSRICGSPSTLGSSFSSRKILRVATATPGANLPFADKTGISLALLHDAKHAFSHLYGPMFTSLAMESCKEILLQDFRPSFVTLALDLTQVLRTYGTESCTHVSSVLRKIPHGCNEPSTRLRHFRLRWYTVAPHGLDTFDI